MKKTKSKEKATSKAKTKSKEKAKIEKKRGQRKLREKRDGRFLSENEKINKSTNGDKKREEGI